MADSAAADAVEHVAANGERGFQLGARPRDRFTDDRAFRSVDALDGLADLVQRRRLAEVPAFGLGEVVEGSGARECVGALAGNGLRPNDEIRGGGHEAARR